MSPFSGAWGGDIRRSHHLDHSWDSSLRWVYSHGVWYLHLLHGLLNWKIYRHFDTLPMLTGSSLPPIPLSDSNLWLQFINHSRHFLSRSKSISLFLVLVRCLCVSVTSSLYLHPSTYPEEYLFIGFLTTSNSSLLKRPWLQLRFSPSCSFDQDVSHPDPPAVCWLSPHTLGPLQAPLLLPETLSSRLPNGVLSVSLMFRFKYGFQLGSVGPTVLVATLEVVGRSSSSTLVCRTDLA